MDEVKRVEQRGTVYKVNSLELYGSFVTVDSTDDGPARALAVVNEGIANGAFTEEDCPVRVYLQSPVGDLLEMYHIHQVPGFSMVAVKIL